MYTQCDKTAMLQIFFKTSDCIEESRSNNCVWGRCCGPVRLDGQDPYYYTITYGRALVASIFSSAILALATISA